MESKADLEKNGALDETLEEAMFAFRLTGDPWFIIERICLIKGIPRPFSAIGPDKPFREVAILDQIISEVQSSPLLADADKCCLFRPREEAINWLQARMRQIADGALAAAGARSNN